MRADEIGTCDVVTVTEDVSVREAARIMRDRNVGDVIVVRFEDGVRSPVGIITDRDIVYQAISLGIDPDALTAGDIMSRDLVTVRSDTDFVVAVRMMAVEGVRRLPVLNHGGALVAVLSLDDAIEELAGQMEDLLQLVAQQRMPGGPKGRMRPGRKRLGPAACSEERSGA